MPEKETLERAAEDKREGKAPSTQAGEFVREEMHHVKEGKHGARSRKQVIAIGLSKARRAGVKLGMTSGRARTRKSAAAGFRKGQKGDPLSGKRKRGGAGRSRKRATAALKALERERSPV
jgi:hypothetical protein